jgi:hypothetical protein
MVKGWDGGGAQCRKVILGWIQSKVTIEGDSCRKLPCITMDKSFLTGTVRKIRAGGGE